MKFIHHLAEQRVAHEHGQDVFVLLAVIASREDKNHYQSPIYVFNDDLAEMAGLSLSAMKRARDKAIAAGLLIHTNGRKSRAARYFVTIPDDNLSGQGEPTSGPYEGVSGSLSGQGEPTSGPPNNPNTEYQNTEEKEAPSHPTTAALVSVKQPHPEPTPFPAELDTETFRAAWGEWKAERAERRIKSYTRRGEATQLAALAKIGPELAIECIRLSIGNGWQGLFPEKFASGAIQPRLSNMPRGAQNDFYVQAMIGEAMSRANGS